MKFFDYIFFRIHRYYEMKKEIPIATGVLFIFILQVVFLFIPFSIINKFTNGFLTAKNLSKNLYWTIYIGAMVCILAINYFRYNKKHIAFLKEKYNNSRLNNRIKTWMIFLLPPSLFIAGVIFLAMISALYKLVFF